MSNLYRRLATVDFLHDYFIDGKLRGLEVLPSKDCARIMSNAGIVWRMIGHTLVLLVKVKSDGTVRAALPPNTVFRFYLVPQSDSFFTISNLPYDAQGDDRFIFSSRSGVVDGENLFLTRPIAAYDGSRAYAVGDVVQVGGNLFEATRPSGGTLPAHGTGDAGWWMPKDAGQYATGADLIAFTGAQYAFPVQPAVASITTALWGENPVTGEFDVPARVEETTEWGEAQSSVRVSLEGLKPGRYRIEVNRESRTIYFDEEAVARKVFAALEIPAGLPESHAHGLFMNDGTLRSPRYTLRIPSRRLRWKYIARTADVEDISDQNEVLSARHHFDLDAPLQFLSSTPIALRETPIPTIFLQSDKLGAVGPIASASPYGLGTCTVDGDVLPCAEIRLNY